MLTRKNGITTESGSSKEKVSYTYSIKMKNWDEIRYAPKASAKRHATHITSWEDLSFDYAAPSAIISILFNTFK
jgi:hypothetical protein